MLVDAITAYAGYMLDPDGHVSSWNSGAKRFKGYTEAEILGEHFSRFYTPEDRQAGMPQEVLELRRPKADLRLRAGASERMARPFGLTL
ncbi:PAS domain S-box-containing protein [Pararhizobium capsulatum DSM 1112]|uniref:PAS domain S-box-containing protein n=1 Tax=Pararhizobium capsulatum DSM 1112 TaxID=1121113 RepID=A0ABU0BZS7_9HYPH|nr:PAS domain S-box-containing protein [Pararhizobium capsulatum DSM 1112]